MRLAGRPSRPSGLRRTVRSRMTLLYGALFLMSGAVLLAAAHGLRVTAVDVSEVALGLLDEEARRRGLAHLITLVHADLSAWVPEPRSYALVLATGYWDADVFACAAAAVTDGGLLGWEALTAEARRRHPDLPPEFCAGPSEPALAVAACTRSIASRAAATSSGPSAPGMIR